MIDPVLMDYLIACDKHLSGNEQKFSSDLGKLLLDELAAYADAQLRVGGEHAYAPLSAMVQQLLPAPEGFEPTGLRT